jgi:glycosyltransferase involved in cell wall biosynthesis
MKVAIVHVQVPFVWGGAEYLSESLAERIRGRGHKVELIRIPFKWYPAETLLDHMLACRLFDVTAGEPDLVISSKFPAYLVPFENKRLWMFHQFRQVYDLWGTPHGWSPDSPEAERVRSMIVAADVRHLSGVGRLFTNSKIVADRLRRFNGIAADAVLYPPLQRPELFREGMTGDYVFYPSRLSSFKRQALAVEAMRYVRSGFRLVIAGKADTDAYQDELEEIIRANGLEDRVELLGFVSEEEKARLMADAFAAMYIPVDEDSYGFVTLEAFHSAKPVITCTDSGGTHEVIEDGHNGLIVEPTAEALAEGMERLWADPAGTRAMGREAHATLSRHRIDWDHILDCLLT